MMVSQRFSDRRSLGVYIYSLVGQPLLLANNKKRRKYLHLVTHADILESGSDSHDCSPTLADLHSPTAILHVWPMTDQSLMPNARTEGLGYVVTVRMPQPDTVHPPNMS